MYCIHCGRKLPEDGSVCACGNLQPGQTVPVQPEKPAPAEEPAYTAPPAPVEPETPAEAPVPVVPAEEPAYTAPPAPAEPETPAEAPVPVVPAEEPAYTAPPASAEPAAQVPAAVQQPAAPYVQPYTYQPPQNPYPQPYVQSPYVPNAAYPYQTAQQARPLAAVQTAVKSLAASPLFLIGAILVSLGFLLSIVSAFVPVDYTRLFSMLPPEVYYELDLSELQYALYTIQYDSALSAFLMQLPGLIFSALAVAGLWMTFASGKSGSSPSIRTSGLTILKVLQVFSIVGCALLALLLLILLVISLITGAIAQSESYYMQDTVGMVVAVVAAVLLLGLAFCAVQIVYSAKVIGSLNAAKAAAAGSAMLKKASMFVAVLGFLMAGYTLIDLYGTFVFSGWLAALRNVCAAGAQIVFGICIIQFNKRVASLRAPAAM